MPIDDLSQTQMHDYVRSLAALSFPRELAPQVGATYYLRLSGVVIAVRLANDDLARALLPALAHLATDALTCAADIVLDVFGGDAAGPIPPPPFSAADYRRYGQRAAAQTDVCAVMHAPDAGMLFAYDYTTHHGICWIEDVTLLSIYERAAPLQTLFYWALRDFGWQVIHAAAVGLEAGGALLVGSTGAGKSTTALASLEQSNNHASALRYLSDDKCLARLTPHAEAFALFNSAKLKVDMLAHFPAFLPLIQGWDDNYKVGKSLAFLYPTYAGKMIQCFPVRALIAPRIAHLKQPRLTLARASDMFRALGPSTVIWLPGAEADNYRFTAELVRTLPCYRLDLAIESARNIAAIQELLQSLP